MDTLDLVAQAKAGDSNAFEELLKLYSDQLYRTAFLYVRNREDALDIVQDTSFKAFLAIKTLKHDQYFSSWITRILINSANEHLKKHKKDLPIEDVEQMIQANDELGAEEIDLIIEVNQLKKKYRDAVILFYFRDLPIKDIARIMKVPENTVKTYLHRGKKQLETKLRGVGFNERKAISESI